MNHHRNCGAPWALNFFLWPFKKKKKKSVFLRTRSEDVPSCLLHIQQCWGFIIYFMVGPWLLPTHDWWLTDFCSPAKKHTLSLHKGVRGGKEKIIFFSKSSFEQEAMKQGRGDVRRYRGRMAGLSSVAPSISTPGWAANGPFTCSCPGMRQPSNDTPPGCEHFSTSWEGDGATGRARNLKTKQRHLWQEAAAVLWWLPGWRGGTGSVW